MHINYTSHTHLRSVILLSPLQGAWRLWCILPCCAFRFQPAATIIRRPGPFRQSQLRKQARFLRAESKTPRHAWPFSIEFLSHADEHFPWAYLSTYGTNYIFDNIRASADDCLRRPTDGSKGHP